MSSRLLPLVSGKRTIVAARPSKRTIVAARPGKLTTAAASSAPDSLVAEEQEEDEDSDDLRDG
jgi:hypothetical protein